MKKILFYILTFFTFLSCEKKPKGDFQSVILYNYGRSEIGTTYDVPLKFIVNSTKEEVLFHLYSFDPNLEAGIYTYNDRDRFDCRMWGPYNCTNMTFYQNRCKWGNKYITDGYVYVERDGDIYTFVVSAQTADGNWQDWQYNGKVKRQDWHEKSNIGGMFAHLSVDDARNFPAVPRPLPQGYNGATMLAFLAGDADYGIAFFLKYMHENPNSPTGTYSVVGNHMIQDIYYPYSSERINPKHLVSGTFTVTRIDKPHKYRVDIDVVDENGRVIQGCFDGGDLTGTNDYE